MIGIFLGTIFATLFGKSLMSRQDREKQENRERLAEYLGYWPTDEQRLELRKQYREKMKAMAEYSLARLEAEREHVGRGYRL